MAPTSDPCCIVRNMMHAKANNFINLTKCYLRYGSKKNTKNICGVVQNVIFSNEGGRMRTNIVATYQLGGNAKKTMTLNIRSVVAPPPPLRISNIMRLHWLV